MTAFLIESYKLLKQDSSDVMVALVAQLAQRFDVDDAYANVRTNVASYPSPFHPSQTIQSVNRLWFTALGLAFASSVLTMLAKQWAHEFTVDMGDLKGVASADRAHKQGRLRTYRYKALVVWRVDYIVAILPLILHLAVLLFGVGLAMITWELDKVSARILTFLVSVTTVIYAVCTILPSIYPRCPYKTPVSHFLCNLWDLIVVQARSIGKAQPTRLKFSNAMEEMEKTEVTSQAHGPKGLDRKSMRALAKLTRSEEVAQAAQKLEEVYKQNSPDGQSATRVALSPGH